VTHLNTGQFPRANVGHQHSIGTAGDTSSYGHGQLEGGEGPGGAAASLPSPRAWPQLVPTGGIEAIGQPKPKASGAEEKKAKPKSDKAKRRRDKAEAEQSNKQGDSADVETGLRPYPHLHTEHLGGHTELTEQNLGAATEYRAVMTDLGRNGPAPIEERMAA
jgi:hypothetical protein